MQHFILKNAHRYDEAVSNLKPQGATYNYIAGYWIDDNSGNAVVTSDGFKRITTKKADRETGEDQKGE